MPTKELINPRKVNSYSMRFSDRARGTKFYRAGFDLPGQPTKFSLRQFRTRTEADDYAIRLILRWMRLYDAALIAGIKKDEPVAIHPEPTA